MGVNTIGVLMEGRMEHVDDVQVRLPEQDELDDIRAVLLDANEMGFATVLVPHLYLDDHNWRGAIKMTDPRRRDEWWASYSALITTAASISAECGVTALSIGVELKAMSAEVDTRTRMRALKEQVRHEYRGLLTYSANWDEAEQVSFWDLLDYAGVNGYYPLVPDPFRGAQSSARRLSMLAKIAGRDVLVLEAGYRSSPMSHERPWEWPDDVRPDVDDGAQARAWAAVLEHWLHAPGVRGLLVWIIPTDPDDPASEPRHGFNPLNKSAEKVIERAFTGRAG